MPFNTNDLYDKYLEGIQVAAPVFRNFGGKKKFHGEICTIKAFEDNSCIKSSFEQDGRGKVLVVDGGGSLHCAMMGDQVAGLGLSHGWEGIIIHGCIRDSNEVGKLNFGVRALATIPRKTVKRKQGVCNIKLHFAAIDFVPGHYVYADQDGIVTAEKALI